MKKITIAIFIAVLACANIVLADILPPGQKVVPVCASFGNTESMLDIMAVYGYETAPGGEKIDFSSFIDGECFKPGYKFNTYKVYGVKTEHALKINAEIDAGTYDPSKDTEAYPASLEPEMGYMQVAADSTLTEVKNIYTIVGFDEDKHVLTIEPLRTEKYDTTSPTPFVVDGMATPVSGYAGEIVTDAGPGTTEPVTQETGGTTGDPAFSDVPSSHANYTAIKYLKDNSIVSGYADGTFKPDNTINRAELSKIIVGAFFASKDITDCAAHFTKEGDYNVTLFSDVIFVMVGGNAPPWFFDYVCVGKLNGFIKGYPDGTFMPAQDINFVEAAKIIAGGFGEEIDMSDPWYKTYVDLLAVNGAIPKTITTFDKKITRGEMAEIIYRMKADMNDLPTNTYSDLK